MSQGGRLLFNKQKELDKLVKRTADLDRRVTAIEWAISDILKALKTLKGETDDREDR